MANDILVPPEAGEPIVDTGTELTPAGSFLLPPGAKVIAPAALQPPGVVASGFGAGRTGLTAAAGSSLELAAAQTGAPVIGGFGAGVRQRAEVEQRQFPQPFSVDEALADPKKFIDITGYSAGNLLASLAASLGTGTILGAASKLAGGRFLPGMVGGAAATSFTNEIGETYQMAREAGATNAESRAIAGGAISGALDFASLLVPAALLLGKKVGPLPFRLAAALIGSPLVEGATETAQDVVKGAFATGNIPETKQLRDTMITTTLGAIPTFGALGTAAAFRPRTAPEAPPAPPPGVAPAPPAPPAAPPEAPVPPGGPEAAPGVEVPFQPLTERPTLPPVAFPGKPGAYTTRPEEEPIQEGTFLSIYGRAPLPPAPQPAPERRIGEGVPAVRTRPYAAPVELDVDGRVIPQNPAVPVFSPYEFETLAKAGIPEAEILQAIRNESFGDIAAIRRKAGLLLTAEQAKAAPALAPRPLELVTEAPRERVKPVTPVTVEDIRNERITEADKHVESLVLANPNLARTGRGKALSGRLKTMLREAVAQSSAPDADTTIGQQMLAQNAAAALKGTMPPVDQQTILDYLTTTVSDVVNTVVTDPRDAPLFSARLTPRAAAIDVILEQLTTTGQPVSNTEARNAALKYVKGLPEDQRAALLADERFVPELADAVKRHLGPNRMLFSKAAMEPKLGTDNPGGEWLQGHRQLNAETGRNAIGAPKRFGPVTGYYRDQKVLVPVDVLAQIPGLAGEQQNVRQDTLQNLIRIMKERGRLPTFSAERDSDYVPFIMVNQDGEAWVNEGNHRIMAAKALGWKYLPTEVRYFSGGEQADGVMSPENIKRYAREAEAAGITMQAYRSRAALVPQTTITFNHWGRPGLSQLDPRMMGRGIKGRDQAVNLEFGSLYTSAVVEGTDYVEPEVQRGQKYVGTLDAAKVYRVTNLREDPLFLKAMQDIKYRYGPDFSIAVAEFQKLVVANGYEAVLYPNGQLRIFVQTRVSKAPTTETLQQNSQGALDAHKATKWSTMNLVTGRDLRGSSGYVVGLPLIPRRDLKDGIVSPEDISSFVALNGTSLSNPANVLHTWFDRSDGESVLSVGTVVPNLPQALQLARASGQIAITDLRTGLEIPVSHPLFDTAQEYNRSVGLPPIGVIPYIQFDPSLGRAVAEAYDLLEVRSTNPEVSTAYEALARETEAQYDHVAKTIKIEPVQQAFPYPNSAEMRRDVFENSHLFVFASSLEHPFLTNEQNYKFRAVHDLYGHAKTGFEFGVHGELNATRAHAQMFSDKANAALLTETTGQNAWVNFGKANEGLPPQNRQYATQKADLLPAMMRDAILRESNKVSRGAHQMVQQLYAERGKAALGYLNTILGAPGNLEVRLQVMDGSAGYFAQALAEGGKNVIGLAYNAQDILSAAAHEGFHFLELNVLAEGERGVIRRAFEPGTAEFNKLMEALKRYDTENGTNLADEAAGNPREARAYAFQFWRNGQLTATGAIESIWQKIRAILTRIINYFDGQGFQTYEDIFTAIDAGYYAKSGIDTMNKAGTEDLLSASSTTYPGAADWIKTGTDLRKLRRRIGGLAFEGEPYGRYWHDESSRAILDLMGGNREEATKFAKLLSIFSPRTTVPLNFKHAWTAWHQFKEGQPIRSGVFPEEMSRSAALVMTGLDRMNKKGEIVGGRKRNNLFVNLMIEIDPLNYGAHTQGGTIDMWMAHAFGYGDKDGKISQSQYSFVEEETRTLANRLGWPIHQVQAAVWVAIKARMDATRKQAKQMGLERGYFRRVVNKDKETIDLFGEVVSRGRSRLELRPDREQAFVRNWIDIALKAPVSPENFRKAGYNFKNAIDDIRLSQNQGKMFSRAALDATLPLPQDGMTMLESDGFELYYSKALLDNMDDQYTKGSAQHMQMLHRVSAAVEEAGAPKQTWDQIFKHAGDSSSGSSMRWVEKNLMSLLKISERSKGVANVANVLFAHSDRKKRLIADSVEKNMSEWLPLSTSTADRDAVSNALMQRTVGNYAVGSPEYNRIRSLLTEHQRRMFDQAGEMVNNMLREEFIADQTVYRQALGAESTAYQTWETSRRAQIEELVRTGYIPERRYGDFVTHGYIKTDQGPVTVFYTQFQTQKQAQDALDHLQKALGPKFPEVTFEWGTRQKVEYDGGISYLDFLDTANRLGIKLTQTERERLAKFTIEADSTRRNRIFRRLNVPGFSTDGERILAEFAVGISNKVAHSEFSAALADAMQGRKVRVGQDANGRPTFAVDPARDVWAGDGPLAGHYRNLAEERVSYVMNPAHDKSNWSSKIRSLASLHFLGGSFAAMGVQLSQLPLATVPYLSQYSNAAESYARVFGGLKAAASNYNVLTNLPKLEDKRGSPIPEVDAVPGLRDALIMAARDGTILDTELFQIMGMARGSIYSRSKRVQNAIKVWMAPFRAGEHINRLATFIAAFKTGQDLSRTGKLPTPTVYEFAKDVVYKTQFRYDEANRPGLARSDLGSLLFVFKSFPIYMVEMITGLYKQSPRAASFALLSLWLAAGTEGLPFMSNILDIIDVISQRLFGSKFNTRRAMRNALKDASEAVVGADLSGLLMTGAINSLTGMQFSSRVGLGDIIPGTRLGAADATYERVLSDVLGPVGAMIEGAVKGVGALTQGEYNRAANEALPVAARNMVKGYNYWTTGVATDPAGRKITDVGHMESFWQSLGFSSASMAEIYAHDRIVKQDAAFYNQVRQQVYDNIVRGIRDGKDQDVKDAFAAAQSWNERYPDTPLMLDARSIRRSIALAGLPLNQRTLLLLPRALRSGARDELLGPT
jgi:hypothetical protein